MQRYFEKHYGLTFDGIPQLETDITKEVDLDKEVRASGFISEQLGENAESVFIEISKNLLEPQASMQDEDGNNEDDQNDEEEDKMEAHEDEDQHDQDDEESEEEQSDEDHPDQNQDADQTEQQQDQNDEEDGSSSSDAEELDANPNRKVRFADTF